MAENPEPPPRQFVDAKTGLLTEAAFRWLEGFRVTNSTDIGSVLSGVSQARAEAAAAQATASAAQQQVSDVGAETLPFSVALDEVFIYEFRFGAGGITSALVTGTPTGGTGPYTYAWTLEEGDALTLSAPTAAATTFSATLDADQILSPVYKLTVTDSLAATCSKTIAVTLASLPAG